jgi:hypothetical protein
MKHKLAGVAALVLMAAMAAAAQAPEKWLHVKVEDKGSKGEIVKVNVPLSLAEKILPAVNVDRLKGGKVRIETAKIHDVDMRAILEAVKGTQDGEFVTIESNKDNVRVAKSGGYLLVKVREVKKDGQQEEVDVKVPMTVVEALLSGDKNELDVLAAIKALAAHGDTVLVEVRGDKETVRVWVDSKNTQG